MPQQFALGRFLVILFHDITCVVLLCFLWNISVIAYKENRCSKSKTRSLKSVNETDNVVQLHILSTGLAKSLIIMIRAVLFGQRKKNYVTHCYCTFNQFILAQIVMTSRHLNMEIITLDLLHVRLIMKICQVYIIFSPPVSS